MIPLPQNLRKNGYDYTQVVRGKRSCIYKQIVGETIIAFEVFIIRVVSGRSINGVWIENREKFSRDKDFGYYEWMRMTWERAQERLNNLKNLYNDERSWK